MIMAACHQVPTMAQELTRLGTFYFWHVWDVIPQALSVCKILAS